MYTKQPQRHLCSVLSFIKKHFILCYRMPVYACQLWSIYTQTSMQRLQVAWNNAYRIMLYIPRVFLRKMLGTWYGPCWDPISLILVTRFSILGTWIGSLKHHKKNLIYSKRCLQPWVGNWEIALQTFSKHGYFSGITTKYSTIISPQRKCTTINSAQNCNCTPTPS